MIRLKPLVIAAITVLLTAALGHGAASSISTSTQSSGGVTVKVSHRNPDPPDHHRFEIVLDSSSVNLDNYDLKSSVLLRAGDKTYRPTTVENKGDGRHREMTVVFPRVDLRGVEVIVRDVAGVKERAFRFIVE
ncbi:MAG TPA: hypothetical protein VKH64_01950 [Candidatus Binatia bacterium]|nr:hypothetical protein [Candidatus Binatia bacterium]